MNIGITIGLTKDNESLWVNGVKLNALYFANLLISMGHNAYIMDMQVKVKEPFEGKVEWDVNKIPIYKYNKIITSTDVVITMGVSVSTPEINRMKGINPNIKFIKYQCGNNYVIDMERVLFKDASEKIGLPWDSGYDEIWYVPQQHNQNKDYFAVTNRMDPQKVRAVPFIWDPMFLEESARYVNTDEYKRISIFEPNMNVVKYSMIPILISENAYRENAEFKIVNVFSGDRLFRHEYFKEVAGKLDLVTKETGGKIKLHSKFPVSDILNNYTDVIISHQWENPLNYAYLDALYLGYPLIHNADLIKDIGYYYKGFNIIEGSNLLKNVLDNFDAEYEKIQVETQEKIERYTLKNKSLRDSYEILLSNLYNNILQETKYDWKTNSIES